MFNNQIIAGAAGQGGSFYPYSIDQSLRLQNGVTQNLTVSSAFPTATDRKKVTISFWYKRSLNSPNAEHVIYGGGSGLMIRFNTNGTTTLYDFGAGSGGWQVYSTTSDRLHRDPSAFYHFALILDSTQATASDRVKFYINGELWSLSAWSVGAGASRYPNLNASFNWHTGSTAKVLTTGVSALHGYVAEFMSIDGQDVTIDGLGETVNGVWVAKEYTGSFGNAGFHLDFANSSAVGNDVSGNNVDFTADSGFAAHDVVPDSPTNNFAVLNPLQNSGGGGTWYAQATLSEGNLKASLPANSVSVASMKSTGKLYAEVRWSTVVNELALGLIIPEEYTTTTAHPINTGANSWRMAYHGYSPADIYLVDEGTSVANPAQAVSAGDIFQVAWDTDSGKIWFGYNNSWYDSSGGTTGDPSTGANATMTATTADLEASLVYIASGNSTAVGVINFGQDSTFAGAISAGGNADANGVGDFKYAPPSGFLALCASNLPEPTIGPNSGVGEQADDYFNTVLYTGNGSTQSITGVGHQPDWTWLKSRSNAQGHNVFDSVRGANKALFPNDANAEFTDTDRLTSFDSDGFSLGADANVNTNSATYVAWNWKAGGTAVSNTDGSITSSVSANQDAGFSIVSYEGTGANATVGHGLSSAPELIIIKERDNSNGWVVSIKGDPTDFLRLDTGAARSDDAAVFNDTAPTNTVFSIGTAAIVNRDSMIAYCFHSVDGYSKVGSYRGNAATDGAFIYLGFRPRWFMFKDLENTNIEWNIYYDEASPFNVMNDYIAAASSATESTNVSTRALDFVSNGVKLRDAYAQNYVANYVYLAFAQAPFKYANAR